MASRKAPILFFLTVTLLFLGLPRAQAADPGEQAFEGHCSLCHSLNVARSQRLTRDQWTGILRRMMALGARISPRNRKLILDYLVRTQGLSGGGGTPPQAGSPPAPSPGYGPGSGYGPGRYGMSPGMMGGQGMGPGMMRGYGGAGPRGYQGPPGSGNFSGGPQTTGKPLTREQAQAIVQSRLERLGNPNLKVGKVTEKDGTISVEVVTKDNSLVEKFNFNRATGSVTRSFH